MGNIGNNPSTADEKIDDPTIRKDMGFARRLGFGGILKLNVGAYRATDPKEWLNAIDPFGPENTVEHLKDYLSKFGVETTVATWGRCIGRFKSQGDYIAKQLPGIKCFGKNSDGTPRHTLMLPYTTEMVPYVLSPNRLVANPWSPKPLP